MTNRTEDARLTLILPLRGRHLHTLRFLYHANRARLAYHIIIADGQVHPSIARVLEQAERLFPNLKIRYWRLPDDTRYGDYYNKLADAAKAVTTDYAMYVDNDDFPVASGIDTCIQFLDTHPDFASCGGGSARISIYGTGEMPLEQATGRVCHLGYRYAPPDDILRDRVSDSMGERVLDVLKNHPGTFYYIYRAKALETVFVEAAQLNATDLNVHEAFCAMRSQTLGKSKGLASCVTYLRQYGSSLGFNRKKDWVHHVLRNRFNDDINNMAQQISRLAADADGTDWAPIDETIRDIYADRLRAQLSFQFNRQPVRDFIRRTMPGWLWWLKRRRPGMQRRDIARFMAELARDGASPAYMKTFGKELAGIIETVESPDFLRFVAATAPELLSHPTN